MAPFFKIKSKSPRVSSEGSSSPNENLQTPQSSRIPSNSSEKVGHALQGKSAASGTEQHVTSHITPIKEQKNQIASFRALPPRTLPIDQSEHFPYQSFSELRRQTFSNPVIMEDDQINGNTVPTQLGTAAETKVPQKVDASRNAGEVQQQARSKIAPSSPWKKKILYNSPFPRFSHAASSFTSEAGALYLMGGLCGKNVFGDMWIVEPIKSTPDNSNDYPYIASAIENFEKIPSPRIGHSSTLIGNAFIVFAGDTVTNTTQELDNKLYFFNITSLKWTITSPEGLKPCGRYGHQIAVLNFENDASPSKWSSYLYVFGGQVENDYFNDMWRFDLSNFRDPKTQWEQIAIDDGDIAPPMTSNHTMTAYNNKLYVYGGTDGISIYNHLLVFDSFTNRWEFCTLKGSVIPPPLQGHAAAIYQNLLFIFGGKTVGGEACDGLYIIDLNTLTCFQLESNLLCSPAQRCGHTITIDPAHEKLLVMGGDQLDNDFTHVSETKNKPVQGSRFEYRNSIIYELDLQLLPHFLKFTSSLDKQPEAKSSQSFRELSEISINNNNEPVGVTRGSSRLSQYAVYEKVSDDDDIKEIVDDQVDDPTVSHPFRRQSEKDLPKLEQDCDNENLALTLPDPGPQSDETEASYTSRGFMRAHGKLSNAPKKKTPYFHVNGDAGEQVLSNAGGFATTLATDSYQNIENTHCNKNSFESSKQEYAGLDTFGPSIRNGSDLNIKSVEEFTNLLHSLKKDMAEKVERANYQLNSLESQRQELIRENELLKSQIAGDAAERGRPIQEKFNEREPFTVVSARNFSDSQRIALENRVTQLTAKNTALLSKVKNYGWLFEQRLQNLDKVNLLVQEQERSIRLLKSHLKGEAAISNKLTELESRIKCAEEKSRYLSDIVGIRDNTTSDVLESFVDKRKCYYLQASQLAETIGELLKSWKDTPRERLLDHLVHDSNSPHQLVGANDGNLAEDLQKQVNELIASKRNDEEKISKLTEELRMYSLKAKELEDSYKKSYASLRNSHKALTVSQSEIEKHKELNKRLMNELKELQMKSMNTSDKEMKDNSSDTSNTSGIDTSFDARYDVKIKDLEAELFIVSQERDQLKEEIISLKKKLYAVSS
ncbi:hypothetical protein KL933_002030 [Ogataea haglerorum]|uniref:Uncharacterized protein n=1 Tax=Ogataea haglerorum TaxID=1937702 RepID=A0AAN6D8A4_9ASCO|nr:hypothetical protein KL933_002030 [Ogataea haglerorum]